MTLFKTVAAAVPILPRPGVSPAMTTTATTTTPPPPPRPPTQPSNPSSVSAAAAAAAAAATVVTAPSSTPVAARPRGPPRERRGKYRCKTCGGLGHTQKTCGRARPATPPAPDAPAVSAVADHVASDANVNVNAPSTPPRNLITMPPLPNTPPERLSPSRLEAAVEAAKRRVMASIIAVAQCETDAALHAATDVFEANTNAFERVASCLFRCVAVESGLDRMGGFSAGRGVKRGRDDLPGDQVMDVVVENGAKEDGTDDQQGEDREEDRVEEERQDERDDTADQEGAQVERDAEQEPEAAEDEGGNGVQSFQRFRATPS